MIEPGLIASLETTDLLRTLRRLAAVPPDPSEDAAMPECAAWTGFLELRRRGDPRATSYFLAAVRALLDRRSSRGVELPVGDADPRDHEQVDDPFLGELWKAYKRCLRQQRTGPAARLLHDIELHLSAH